MGLAVDGMNVCAQKQAGDYLCFLNQAPGKVCNMKRALQGNSTAGDRPAPCSRRRTEAGMKKEWMGRCC